MAQAVAYGGVEAGAKPLFSERYTRWALVLLMFVYTSNFIDRTILATLGQPIKVDLKISDASLGLLQGFAFAIFYTVLGIPIARLAERRSRVTILSVCLVVWSGMTALCGVAQSFLQLLLFRFGVGVGEAGCSPAAHSLIADYFPSARRSSALAVYSFGIPLGGMIGAVAGGWIAEHMSWRVAFFIVGAPGLVLALIARLVLREPPRGHSEIAGPAGETAPTPSLIAVAKRLFGAPSFRHMTAGVTLVSFAGYGVGGFAQPYFIRQFHLGLAEVGLVFGVITGVSTGLGTLLGGFVTDWAGRRDRRWYSLVPGIGFLIATPFYVAAYLAPSWQLAALCLVLPGVFSYTYLGPTFGVMHNLVEPRMRATATALLFFVLNFIALGGGPFFTGLMSDILAQHAFTAAGLGQFLSVCLGGVAPKGSPAALHALCLATSAHATRWAILATYAFGVWGALHYFLGAIRIRQDLAAAEARAAA
ncbi:MAG: MFS transporter [Caulobacteraceae bacterium]|nr:MFS transporter [Caulobacteraceae bacterium]